MNQPSGPALFVSHHSSQVEVAEHVERALNARGVRCWIAPRDVEPGASFARAIPDAIEQSSAVLLLFSAASVASPHVERELILADQLGKPIIPLRIERIVDPGGLRYHLASAQWIDWLEQREAAIDRIAARAHEFAQSTAGGTSPPRSGPPTPPYSPHHPVSPPPSYSEPFPPPTPPGPTSGRTSPWLWIALGALGLAVLVVVLVAMDLNTPPAPAPTAAADPGSSSASAGTGRSSASAGTGSPSASADSGGSRGSNVSSSAPAQESGGGVTPEWFAGVWADTRDCREPYRFDAGGLVTAPDGGQGYWSIEDGNVLVVSGAAGSERREVRRVSDDEVSSSDGPGYRCFPTTSRD